MSRTYKSNLPVKYDPCDFVANGMCTSMIPNRELTREELDFIEGRFKKFARKCNGKITVVVDKL